MTNRTIGFNHNGVEHEYSPVLVEREPDVLTTKDLGLVLTSLKTPFHDYQNSASLAISENGLPIQDPKQLEVYQQKLNIARIYGQDLSEVPAPHSFFIEPLERTNNPNTTLVNTYAFPGKILQWSQGLIRTEQFVEPEFAVKELDLNKKRYTPNSKTLREYGYAEEGVRRLTNLGLMTQIISLANGLWRVQVNPDLGQIQILLTDNIVKRHNLKSPSGDTPLGVGFHVTSGLTPFRFDGSYIEGYDPIEALPKFTTAVQELLISELNTRPAVVAATEDVIAKFQ